MEPTPPNHPNKPNPAKEDKKTKLSWPEQPIFEFAHDDGWPLYQQLEQNVDFSSTTHLHKLQIKRFLVQPQNQHPKLLMMNEEDGRQHEHQGKKISKYLRFGYRLREYIDNQVKQYYRARNTPAYMSTRVKGQIPSSPLVKEKKQFCIIPLQEYNYLCQETIRYESFINSKLYILKQYRQEIFDIISNSMKKKEKQMQEGPINRQDLKFSLKDLEERQIIAKIKLRDEQKVGSKRVKLKPFIVSRGLTSEFEQFLTKSQRPFIYFAGEHQISPFRLGQGIQQGPQQVRPTKRDAEL